MPFDPNSPFDPADPWQWWRTRILPHILVQPNAPPNAVSGQAPNPTNLPNGSLVPAGALEDDGFPNDWIYPDNQNAAASAAAPGTAPPAPSPQPNPAAFNRPPARFDPYEAYWAQIPASRVGAMAWHQPIFLSPDSFSPQDTPSSTRGTSPPAFSNPLAQFLPATSAPPDFGTGRHPGWHREIGRRAGEGQRSMGPTRGRHSRRHRQIGCRVCIVRPRVARRLARPVRIVGKSATRGFEGAGGRILPVQLATVPPAQCDRASGRSLLSQSPK
jgi:hypothetical protein